VRVGTVRRPPRGVPKIEHASRDFYDVWLPDLAPSEGLVKEAAQASDDRAWSRFVKRYRAEMKRPEAARLLALLAALSHQANLAVGCYCADASRCHRSVLKALLEEHGARVVGADAEEPAPGRRGGRRALPALRRHFAPLPTVFVIQAGNSVYNPGTFRFETRQRRHASWYADHVYLQSCRRSMRRCLP
jgi:uncharacterized protein YeaO (DUF488 family)